MYKLWDKHVHVAFVLEQKYVYCDTAAQRMDCNNTKNVIIKILYTLLAKID